MMTFVIDLFIFNLKLLSFAIGSVYYATSTHDSGHGVVMNNPVTILVVDDDKMNRDLLHELILALSYTPILADNGLSALAQIKKQPPDLVLLDILMPEMDGYEVLKHMKNDNVLRHIPVIMISAVDETESVGQCIEEGADDYLLKPFNQTLLRARIGASLDRKQLHDQEQKYQQQIEDYNINLEHLVGKQVREIGAGQLGTIFSMAKLSESRDPETGEHIQRMCEYCKVIAERLRLMPKYSSLIDDEYIDNIFAAAPLHDIGKVGIPDRILQKPGKLNQEEFAIMKMHTTIGGETLREVDQKYPGNSFVRLGIDIAECHHEKWDGSGYPRGLAGEDIPLASRILAIGDVYDALVSKRCYKESFTHARSREIILEGHGKHFDPDVADAFVSVEDKFIAIKQRNVDTHKELLV